MNCISDRQELLDNFKSKINKYDYLIKRSQYKLRGFWQTKTFLQYLQKNEKEKQISLDEYVFTAQQKSGALICLPIELALISAERMDDINVAKMACYNFSVGYQIADDLEDIIKDTKHSQAGQSLNITTVLKESGAVDIHQKATMMCNKYLDDAMTYANQLPNESGSFLVSLATKLKRKISHNLI